MSMRWQLQVLSVYASSSAEQLLAYPCVWLLGVARTTWLWL